MLIVDTYNVLGVTGSLPPELAGIGVDDLARLVDRSRWGRQQVKLVCDGTSPRGQRREADRGIGRVRAEYAGGGVEADERIEGLISASSSPKRLTVVSSDRRIRVAARRRRCKWLASDEFLRVLAVDAGKPGRKPLKPAFTKDVPLKPGQVRAWQDEFGPEAEQLAKAAGTAKPPAQQPARSKPAKPKPAPAPPQKPAPAPKPDPLLNEALEEWRGRLSLDDLDMSKWLGDQDQPGKPSR